MAFSAGAIVGTLSMDVSPYAKGMLQAESIAKLFPSVVTSFIANPLLGAIDIAKSFGETIVEAFNQAAERADNLGDMARNVGVAVDQLHGLGLIAAQSGSSIEGVADGYRFLGRAAAEAADGQQTFIDAFAKAGVVATDANGKIKPLNMLMMQLADGMAAMPDGAGKVDVAMTLLGRSGTDLVGTLSQGSRAITEQIDTFRKWGTVVTDESVKSADAWQDSIGQMKYRWEGLQNILGQNLRIALLPELDKLSGWADSHMPQIISGIQDAVASAKGMIPALVEIVQLAGQGARKVQQLFDVLGLTDPNNRYGHPYDLPGLSGQVFGGLSGNDLAKMGQKGAADVKKLVNDYQAAGRSLAASLGEAARDSFSWMPETREKARNMLDDLTKAEAQAANAKKQLDALGQRSARGEATPAADWNKAIAQAVEYAQKVDAARDLLAKMADWAKGVGSETDKRFIDATQSLNAFNRSLVSARQVSQELRNALTRPLADEVSSLVSPLRSALQLIEQAKKDAASAPAHPVAQAVQATRVQPAEAPSVIPHLSMPEMRDATFVASTLAQQSTLANQSFTSLAATLSGSLATAAAQGVAALNPLLNVIRSMNDEVAKLLFPLADVVRSLNGMPAAPAPAAPAPGGVTPAAGGVNTGNIIINPQIDAGETAAKIAAKIAPMIEKAVSDRMRQFQSHVDGQRVARGLGS